jgi:hypothetical protein
VSPLFRRSEEKVARKAAARQEIERLRGLGIDELTVAVFPGLVPDGPKHGASVTRQQLCQYLLADHPGAGHLATLDLMPTVQKALDRLEGIGLVSPISIQREPVWRLTPLGESVLADGSLRQRLRGR